MGTVLGSMAVSGKIALENSMCPWIATSQHPSRSIAIHHHPSPPIAIYRHLSPLTSPPVAIYRHRPPSITNSGSRATPRPLREGLTYAYAQPVLPERCLRPRLRPAQCFNAPDQSPRSHLS